MGEHIDNRSDHEPSPSTVETRNLCNGHDWASSSSSICFEINANEKNWPGREFERNFRSGSALFARGRFNRNEEEEARKKESYMITQSRVSSPVEVTREEKKPIHIPSRLHELVSRRPTQGPSVKYRMSSTFSKEKRAIFTRKNKASANFPFLVGEALEVEAVISQIKRSANEIGLDLRKEVICVGPTVCAELEKRSQEFRFKTIGHGHYQLEANGCGIAEFRCGSTSTDPLRTCSIFLPDSHSYVEERESVKYLVDSMLEGFKRKSFSTVTASGQIEVEFRAEEAPRLTFRELSSWLIINFLLRCDVEAFLDKDSIQQVRKLSLFERKQLRTHFPINFSANAVCAKFSSILHRQEFSQLCPDISFITPPGFFPGITNVESPLKTASAEFIWSRTPPCRKAMLTLKNAADVVFAEQVLRLHSISVSFDRGRQYMVGNLKLAIGSLPVFVCDDDYLRWYLNRILGRNKIEFTSARLYRAIPKASSSIASEKERIAKRLIVSANMLGIWTGDEVNFHDRHELSELAQKSDRHPWRMTFCEPDDEQTHELKVRVDFYNYEFGMQLMAELCDKMPSTEFFYLDDRDITGVRIVPYIEWAIPVSRSIRYAHHENICALSSTMKGVIFDGVKSREEEYKHAHIEEHFEEDQDEGTMSVVGYPESNVEKSFHELSQKIFIPRKILQKSDFPYLFYGMGLEYVHLQVEKKFGMVVMDVDNFGQRMLFFGQNEHVWRLVSSLEQFARSKDEYEITTAIELQRPRFNQCFSEILKIFFEERYPQILPEIRNGVLEFRGSLSAFEKFSKFLEDLNDKILEIAGVPMVATRPDCPICLCSISDDFFRLEVCGHLYCKPCYIDEVKNSLQSHVFPLKCSVDGCLAFISAFDLKVLLVGGDRRLKFLDKERTKALTSSAIQYALRDPTSGIRACRTVDCSGVFNSYDQDNRQMVVECGTCRRTACSLCFLEPHQGYTCEQFDQIRADADLSIRTYMKSVDPSRIRKCPNPGCRVFIEKQAGCNHMYCEYCKVHFCWICPDFVGTSSGEIYKHLTTVHGGMGGGWHIDEVHNVVLRAPDGEFDADLQMAILGHGPPAVF